MKIIVSVLFTAVLLCGCQKPETPKPATNKIQRWEYKVVSVECYAHHMAHMAMLQLGTNSDWAFQQMSSAESLSGFFDIVSFPSVHDYSSDLPERYSPDLPKLGSDGWELVSAVPLLETMPRAEYGRGDQTKVYSNMRTGEIILIFKRPK